MKKKALASDRGQHDTERREPAQPVPIAKHTLYGMLPVYFSFVITPAISEEPRCSIDAAGAVRGIITRCAGQLLCVARVIDRLNVDGRGE